MGRGVLAAPSRQRITRRHPTVVTQSRTPCGDGELIAVHDVSSCTHERSRPLAHLALAPTTIGALVAGGMIVVSFLVGALIKQGGFPALISSACRV